MKPSLYGAFWQNPHASHDSSKVGSLGLGVNPAVCPLSRLRTQMGRDSWYYQWPSRPTKIPPDLDTKTPLGFFFFLFLFF